MTVSFRHFRIGGGLTLKLDYSTTPPNLKTSNELGVSGGGSFIFGLGLIHGGSDKFVIVHIGSDHYVANAFASVLLGYRYSRGVEPMPVEIPQTTHLITLEGNLKTVFHAASFNNVDFDVGPAGSLSYTFQTGKIHDFSVGLAFGIPQLDASTITVGYRRNRIWDSPGHGEKWADGAFLEFQIHAGGIYVGGF